MVGCRHGAKNTLDLNYLYLAEKLGVDIIPETKVIDVKSVDSNKYKVSAHTRLGMHRFLAIFKHRNTVEGTRAVA